MQEWEKNARLDPLFAILSSPHGRGGQWDLEQFFATGRTEVDRVFSYLTEIDATLATPGVSSILAAVSGVSRKLWPRALPQDWELTYRRG